MKIMNNDLRHISGILTDFEPISLNEMDNVKLMNRVDTKFIFNLDNLPEFLYKIKDYYKVLEINSNYIFKYKTTYFDTDDLSMYMAHHNGKLNRYKIRYREYLDSNLEYLEIKFKTNKKRTVKKRIQQYNNYSGLLFDNKQFIESLTPYRSENLKMTLIDIFSRFTLVHKENKERLTCDMSLQFDNFNNNKELANLVIIEVKQDNYSNSSDIIRALNSGKVMRTRISKYCIGINLLTDNVKGNRFKEKLLTIQKIQDYAN